METQNQEKIRVLTIEDDSLLLDLLAHRISNNGWEVFSATNGETGLQLAKEHTPHIILLDILLPGMNGHELLKKIKEVPTLTQVPVLILSNYGEEKEMQESLKLGAINHLIKAEISPGEVVEKIKEILELPK